MEEEEEIQAYTKKNMLPKVQNPYLAYVTGCIFSTYIDYKNIYISIIFTAQQFAQKTN